MPRPIKRESGSLLFNRSFVICVGLALVAGIGLLLGVRRILQADSIEQRDYDVIGRLEEVRGSTRSAVSNMRAYMLTADDVRQQGFLSDLDVTRSQLDQLEELTGEDTTSITLYSDLSTFSSLLSSAMDGRAESGQAAAARLAEDPKLQSATSKMDSDISAQISKLNDSLGVYREKRQDDYLLTEIAFLATMLCGSLGLFLSAVGLKREAAQRQLAEAKHASARQDLLTAQSMLEFSDQKDALTGLLNREAFDRILVQEYHKNAKLKSPLSVVIVDLDHLAQVREVKGLATSEEVLRQAASILKDSFRGADVCCRYSQSEFAIILPRATLQHATIAAERARVNIEQGEWPNCNITASFGAAQADFLKEVGEIVSRAEQAVDYARRTGRNRVTAIRAYLPLSA
jgi:diguanylate cyclase (GGDEF)-like protein